MFCEKCGAQIPDGGDTMCQNCRARFGGAQPVQPNFGQPVQPMGQPVQPTAQKAGFSLNTITGNPMIMMIIKLALGAISLWAAFGPLLKYVAVGASAFGQSKVETSSLIEATNGSGVPGDIMGFRVVGIIFMVISIILALAGIALTLLPKVAPQFKLPFPLPSCSSYAATAGALLFSIIGEFITIGFCGKMLGYLKESVGTLSSFMIVSLSGFGIFMMILSFLALGATVFLSYVDLKKK